MVWETATGGRHGGASLLAKNAINLKAQELLEGAKSRDGVLIDGLVGAGGWGCSGDVAIVFEIIEHRGHIEGIAKSKGRNVFDICRLESQLWDRIMTVRDGLLFGGRQFLRLGGPILLTIRVQLLDRHDGYL
jgi:hypothetical protein